MSLYIYKRPKDRYNLKGPLWFLFFFIVKVFSFGFGPETGFFRFGYSPRLGAFTGVFIQNLPVD